ncbi:MAG: acetyl-CoA carboxylase biotin carboxylase subunit [Bacteroidota bacterium]
MNRKIQKVLIANRGEIALRIIRTVREIGLKSVAVFSDADGEMPFVKWADEAIHIGPAVAAQSYLDIDKIINVAKKSNVDAIHPGYGFLSENAEFAKRVEEEGLIFIGPSSHAIHIMGNKLLAKELAREYQIPLCPGTDDAISDASEAKKIADEIGYPILIKAASGGGGKGMRIVNSPDEFEDQMARAMSEAKTSFNDERVFVEKYVASGRHIEFQIIADKKGNCIHLFERECSVQRRHQKVIEEAPSCILTDEKRKEMGECSVRIAKACNYSGAGTVEYLLDQDGSFYFLEMNTRLQVEHPVTECITGIDLVREMIEIAEGKELSFKQEDLEIHGHSIELRVNAEDPLNDFLPSNGLITRYSLPKGPGVRVDDGFEENLEVSMFYDSMISKLIVYARNRDEAMDRMIRAIEEYDIGGIETTLEFGSWICKNEYFRKGDFDTNFIKNHFNSSYEYEYEEEEREALAIALGTFKSQKKENSAQNVPSVKSKWKEKRKLLS